MSTSARRQTTDSGARGLGEVQQRVLLRAGQLPQGASPLQALSPQTEELEERAVDAHAHKRSRSMPTQGINGYTDDTQGINRYTSPQPACLALGRASALSARDPTLSWKELPTCARSSPVAVRS